MAQAKKEDSWHLDTRSFGRRKADAELLAELKKSRELCEKGISLAKILILLLLLNFNIEIRQNPELEVLEPVINAITGDF